mgnify:CR=1 FL=1
MVSDDAAARTWCTPGQPAELLRSYAPPGRPSLADCLPYALSATEGDPVRRARVMDAARTVGIGDLP